MPSQAPQHNKPIGKVIGGNIRVAREALQLTQSQLAARLSMESMSVSRWERGLVVPTVESLIQLAAALDRDPAWFYVDHDAGGES